MLTKGKGYRKPAVDAGGKKVVKICKMQDFSTEELFKTLCRVVITFDEKSESYDYCQPIITNIR